ncbi:uncharacterized protein LOC122248975 isoform X2 [Penaeus japonicus]|uniref:uncharacterized protein LOC122248975 isoform X2 n=1 Tax=Penaeus japonicus TaxID=27405 RepID=UPI001C711D8E|nr:uncharacterized protein LOC122248975 isoform X2 [Penaeus japonicus]
MDSFVTSASPAMNEASLRQMRAQQQQQYFQEMSQRPQTMRKLELTEMKTVKWAMSLAVVRETVRTFAEKLPKGKKIPIIGWMVVLTEMVFIWWWTFLHNLPWPALLLDLLAAGDSFAFRILDFLQQRLEWWSDAWGVRFMWLRESVEISLDKGITVLDSYFGSLQDWVLYAFDVLLTPVRYVFKLTNSYSQSVAFRQTVLKEDEERRNSRKNFETEDEEDTEGWGEEDYLSDNSTSGSKRIARKDKQGLPCSRANMSPEEKLRAAMYQRVRRELGLMRKHSVRFSRGIVTYAKQMVEPRIRPYAESFQDSCLRWAKEHGILDLMEELMEQMRGRSIPGKILTLARTLCAAFLAFLLHLTRGKRIKRTRSMRTESLRRRAQNMSCSSTPLPLSPSALQQSSEPAPLPQLEVPVTLPPAALKEEEEDLDASQAKDSALGSEDNHSDVPDSDHAFSPIEESEEHDSEAKTSPGSRSLGGIESDLAEHERRSVGVEGQISTKQRKSSKGGFKKKVTIQ